MGGVFSILKTGVKEGAIVLVAQVAARKGINLAARFNPLRGIAGSAVSGLLVPVVVTMIARKVSPANARLIAAAAFAEGMKDILSQTPVGPFLSDVLDAGDQPTEYGAYPQIASPAMGAYPGGYADVGEESFVQ
jgi:hypothetical protein